MRDSLEKCRGVKKVSLEYIAYAEEHRGEPVKVAFPLEAPVEQTFMLGPTAKMTVTLGRFADAQALAAAVRLLHVTVIE